MPTLRSAAAKLALSFPKDDSVRQELATLLKQARGHRWKSIVQGDKIRTSFADHPDNAFLIEEMPGKPVKRKVRRMLFETKWTLPHLNPGSAFLMTNILRDAGVKKGMSYDQAVNAVRKAFALAGKKTIAEAARLTKEYPDASYNTPEGAEKTLKSMNVLKNPGYEQTVSWLTVEPSDYKDISFKGKDFNGTSEWTEFKFFPDKQDEYMAQMEGMREFYMSTSAGGARKLFKLLKADPSVVRNMTLRQFTDLLNKTKIAYRYVPTVWR